MKHTKQIYFDENCLFVLNALYIQRINQNKKTPYSTLVKEGLNLLYDQEFGQKKEHPFTCERCGYRARNDESISGWNIMGDKKNETGNWDYLCTTCNEKELGIQCEESKKE